MPISKTKCWPQTTRKLLDLREFNFLILGLIFSLHLQDVHGGPMYTLKQNLKGMIKGKIRRKQESKRECSHLSLDKNKGVVKK